VIFLLNEVDDLPIGLFHSIWEGYQEQKKNDYLSYLKSLAKDGVFVNLDTDEEYNQIRKKMAVTADRD
jgi:hypothetical protein